MKIINVAQGSDEWLRARAGVITASEFDNIVKHDFTPRDSKGTETYMCQKLAEKWTGGPLPTYTSFGDMEQGTLREEKAIPWAALELDMDIQRVGLITTDDGCSGCSPDGLLNCTEAGQFVWKIRHPPNDTASGGLEAKCPKIETHVGYLLANTLPPIYAAQVHGSMYVTGAPWWYFLSYHPTMPKLLLKIARDEKIQKALHESLTGFLERFDMAYARLLLRGEPPVNPERAWKNAAVIIDQPVDLWRNSQ